MLLKCKTLHSVETCCRLWLLVVGCLRSWVETWAGRLRAGRPEWVKSWARNGESYINANVLVVENAAKCAKVSHGGLLVGEGASSEECQNRDECQTVVLLISWSVVRILERERWYFFLPRLWWMTSVPARSWNIGTWAVLVEKLHVPLCLAAGESGLMLNETDLLFGYGVWY